MMHPVDFIREKRDGKSHDPAALGAWVRAFTAGEVPDYQVAAWLMAVYFRGLNEDETLALTEAMASSGEMLDLEGLGPTVDKHSSGGVGDKTTLVVAPILAAAGAVVAKMSGRGLAHTGGTIDKLESIPGFRSSLDKDEFLRQAKTVGMVVAGQSADLAPADGRLYALRDVTATVDSIPLIASSIMSKKLAAGAGAIVLDVKVGKGAFMKTPEAAKELAALMVRLGRRAGRRVAAVISRMDQPLGQAVGNAIEVQEAIRTLNGEGPADLTELALTLAEEGLALAGLPPERARAVWQSGSALAKFREFVAAQGGDPRVVDEPERLALAPEVEEVRADSGGVVSALDALKVGVAAMRLGGGREKKGDPVDHGVGVYLLKKIGDPVRPGEVLARLYHRGRGLEEARALVASAYRVAEAAETPSLVVEVVR